MIVAVPSQPTMVQMECTKPAVPLHLSIVREKPLCSAPQITKTESVAPSDLPSAAGPDISSRSPYHGSSSASHVKSEQSDINSGSGPKG